VEDLYVRDRKGYNWEKEEIPMDLIKASLKKKEILRQATKGVAFLHAMGFVHRNLKPSNFLIAQIQLEKTKDKTRFKYLVKVSDFRMSKDLVTNPEDSGRKGSDGWISPDSRPKDDATDNTQVSNDDTDIIQTNPSEDVFIHGCFFYYVLTNGKHPFGRLRNTRITNINTKTFEVYRDDWAPFKVEKGEANYASQQDEIDYQAGTKEEMQQAVSLLRDMLKFNPNERPALKKILDRAYCLPDDYYKLYDLPEIKPGLCVIFNQEIFDYVKILLYVGYKIELYILEFSYLQEKKNRYGTEKDLEALSGVFKDFGFDVKHHDNLKAQQLCDEIIKLGKRDFSEYACLIVCILSHGNEGIVCGTEYHQQVSIEDAKKQFNNFNCPTLRGKPKIWIIQSCQGNLKQEDLEESTPPLKPKKTRPTPHPTNQGNLPNTGIIFILFLVMKLLFG
jgi:serine/threonine protein kinase